MLNARGCTWSGFACNCHERGAALPPAAASSRPSPRFGHAEPLLAISGPDDRASRIIAMIREALPSDVPGIQRVRASVLENRLSSRTIDDSEVLQAITRDGKGWVIEHLGAVVAFGIASQASRSIWALFVQPDQEHRGHGRCLHDAMVRWLFAQGASPISLSTEPGTRAARFYEAAGWAPTGTTPSGELRFELSPP